MLERIGDMINSGFEEFLIGFISPIFTVVDWFLSVFTQYGMLNDLLNISWINQFILGSQAIAGAILACRFAWEALMMASLRSEGAPTDPGGLLKRTVMSAIAIAGGPWVIRNAIIIGNQFALWVGNVGIGVGLSDLSLEGLVGTVGTSVLFGTLLSPIIVLGGGILTFLVFMQALIRTVEITLTAIISPYAAIGHMSGGGMADMWVKEVIIISMTHAVQMLLLYMSIAFLLAPSDYGFGTQFEIKLFMWLAALWVSFKSPKILRNYAYHTGMSSAAGSLGQSALYRIASTVGRK
ncbi:MAG: hypothetical protein APF76_04695 [Desulfitibacter sp. BRH_c19]|nr:MAG: hypothetical protein APF76_04695 [Desulfitibacter sp. BRH_c19]